MNFNPDAEDHENQDSGYNEQEMDFFTEEEIKNGDFREIPDEVIFLIHLTPSIFR